MNAPRSVRCLVLTESGGRYALWLAAGEAEGGDWWMRHMPPPDRHGDPLVGAWRPIGAPTPWPPVRGEQMWFRWRRQSLGPDRHERWRRTSPVVAVQSWDGDSAWPGDPPVPRPCEVDRR